MDSCSKMISYSLFSLSLLGIIHLDAMQDASESTISPEFRTATSKQALLHYCVMKEIYQHIKRTVNPFYDSSDDNDSSDDVNTSVNPNYGKTKQGLVITFIDNIVTRLHTPWGVIESRSPYCELGSWLEARFSTRTFVDAKDKGEGFCIIFKTAPNGESLPVPFARRASDWRYDELFPYFTEIKAGDFAIVRKVLPELEIEYQHYNSSR